LTMKALEITSKENEFRGYYGRYNKKKDEITRWHKEPDESRPHFRRIDPRDIFNLLKKYENPEKYIKIGRENLWRPDSVANIMKCSSPEECEKIFKITKETTWLLEHVFYIIRNNPNPEWVFEIAKEFGLQNPRSIEELTIKSKDHVEKVISIAREKKWHPRDVSWVMENYPEYLSLIFEIGEREFNINYEELVLSTIGSILKFEKTKAKELYGKYLKDDFDSYKKDPIFKQIVEKNIEIITKYRDYGIIQVQEKGIREFARNSATKLYKDWDVVLSYSDVDYISCISNSISVFDLECYETDETYLEIIRDEILPTIRYDFDISVEVEHLAHEKAQVIIKYRDRDYIIELEHVGDYINLGNLVKGFNRIFRETGWKERLYIVIDNAAIIWITPEIKRRLEQEKGWIFHPEKVTDDSIVN